MKNAIGPQRTLLLHMTCVSILPFPEVILPFFSPLNHVSLTIVALVCCFCLPYTHFSFFGVTEPEFSFRKRYPSDLKVHLSGMAIAWSQELEFIDNKKAKELERFHPSCGARKA